MGGYDTMAQLDTESTVFYHLYPVDWTPMFDA